MSLHNALLTYQYCCNDQNNGGFHWTPHTFKTKIQKQIVNTFLFQDKGYTNTCCITTFYSSSTELMRVRYTQHIQIAKVLPFHFGPGLVSQWCLLQYNENTNHYASTKHLRSERTAMGRRILFDSHICWDIRPHQTLLFQQNLLGSPNCTLTTLPARFLV